VLALLKSGVTGIETWANGAPFLFARMRFEMRDRQLPQARVGCADISSYGAYKRFNPAAIFA
jgi:hypothetical protein